VQSLFHGGPRSVCGQDEEQGANNYHLCKASDLKPSTRNVINYTIRVLQEIVATFQITPLFNFSLWIQVSFGFDITLVDMNCKKNNRFGYIRVRKG